MRWMGLVPIVLLVGCATVEDRAERNAERLGGAVKEYCEEVPEGVREEIRYRVNEEASPHSAEVTCE